MIEISMTFADMFSRTLSKTLSNMFSSTQGREITTGRERKGKRAKGGGGSDEEREGGGKGF